MIASRKYVKLNTAVDAMPRDIPWSKPELKWDGAWSSASRGTMAWRGVPYAFNFNGTARLVMGGHDGKTWYSDDKAKTWILNSSPLAQTAYYTYAFASNDSVLIGCGHYIARSLDGSKTWQRVYTPYDSAWRFVKWIPQWNIFIVVGAAAYTRRILTLNAMGLNPLNKSSTGGYYNIGFSPTFNRAVCLPHAEGGGTTQYAVCTGDMTASTWQYFNPPTGSAINSRYGAANLPNGELWTVGSDSTTSVANGFMISRDGGRTFERPIKPNQIPGIPTAYDNVGFVIYDERLRWLICEVFQSGPGVTTSAQYFSRDNGLSFEPTDVRYPLRGSNMTRPQGVQWSTSAGCIVGSDSDSNPTLYYSRSGMFK